jgi:O-antigen ligase
MTIAMIIFVMVGILSPSLKKDFLKFSKNPAYWAPVGIFLLFLISALCSTNWAEGIIRVRIALPLLVLPFSFAMMPRFSKQQYQQLLSIFIYAMFLTCIGVLIYYLMNYAEMQERLRVSKAIATPNGEHIRFSLMINLAVFAGFWLLQERFSWKTKWEQWLLVSSILFLIFMIHLLSVRIAVGVFYCGLFATILYYIIRKNRFKTGLILLALGVSTPYLAYNYIPSVHSKVHLTLYNWDMYNKGHIGELSDTQRLLSYKIAWQVGQSAPWTGVGIGDLKDEQAVIYQKEYPEQKVMYPHNFFLTIYAATGILGLLFFLFCFFFPLFYNGNYRNLFFLLFFMTIFLSFMTENTLLMAIGVAMYSFFLLLSINYLSEPPKTDIH